MAASVGFWEQPPRADEEPLAITGVDYRFQTTLESGTDSFTPPVPSSKVLASPCLWDFGGSLAGDPAGDRAIPRVDVGPEGRDPGDRHDGDEGPEQDVLDQVLALVVADQTRKHVTLLCQRFVSTIDGRCPRRGKLSVATMLSNRVAICISASIEISECADS